MSKPTATNRFNYLMWCFAIIVVLTAIATCNPNIIN